MQEAETVEIRGTVPSLKGTMSGSIKKYTVEVNIGNTQEDGTYRERASIESKKAMTKETRMVVCIKTFQTRSALGSTSSSNLATALVKKLLSLNESASMKHPGFLAQPQVSFNIELLLPSYGEVKGKMRQDTLS